MNLFGGTPFWPTRNGLLSVYPPLTERVETEVAIVGGGITGALVAWHLAEAGVACVVLDRRDVTQGSTCASTALLQYEIDVPLHRLAKRIGEADAVRAYRTSLQALRSLLALSRRLGNPAHMEKTGALQGATLAADIGSLKREYALRMQHGFASEYWDRKEVRRNSSLPYHAALCTGDAAQMDPHRFASALLSQAAVKGVSIFDKTRVTRCRARGTGVWLETDRNLRVKARHLVVATGYEAAPELPKNLYQLYSTYALVTEPVDAFRKGVWPDRKVIWETSHPYHYLRQTDDGRILIGGGDVPHSRGDTRDRLLPGKRAALLRRLKHLFPGLHTEPAYSWCGTFAETPDGLPCIGRCPTQPRNVYYTLGYGGNGITFSLIAAEIIRDLVMGRESENGDLFRMDRPSLRKP